MNNSSRLIKYLQDIETRLSYIGILLHMLGSINTADAELLSEEISGVMTDIENLRLRLEIRACRRST